MSLLSRNSPRRMRAKKEEKRTPRVGEVKTPTLGPVVKKQAPDADSNQIMIDKYAYKQVAEEPKQLNRSLNEKPTTIVDPLLIPSTAKSKQSLPQAEASFGLYDLSFFCEERIHQAIFAPKALKEAKIRKLNLDFINNKLEVYAEHSQEVTIGSFKDKLYYIGGEVLIPEEFINITGFMRKFLGIETVNVLYETGEVLPLTCKFCNFWNTRIEKFWRPVNMPLDRSYMLDEDICLDCNLVCVFRRKQMNT